MSPLQRYISEELTHFVGKDLPDEDQQYSLLVKILNSGWLTHPPHNPNISGNLQVREGAPLAEMYSPEVVCFCDIPVEDLGIHTIKYSRFGLAFLKSFLVKKGANPVFYVAANSLVQVLGDLSHAARRQATDLPPLEATDALFDKVPRSQHFEKMMKEYLDVFHQLQKTMMERSSSPGVPKEWLRLRRLTELSRFIDFQIFSFLKVFDDAKTDQDPANYYMEREWRMLGNLRFGLRDVRHVLLPESYSTGLRTDVPAYAGQVTFLD
jgi:hypothetical protein